RAARARVDPRTVWLDRAPLWPRDPEARSGAAFCGIRAIARGRRRQADAGGAESPPPALPADPRTGTGRTGLARTVQPAPATGGHGRFLVQPFQRVRRQGARPAVDRRL